MPDPVGRLYGPPIAYGKAANVGVAGAMEHGAAMIHVRLGKPMRSAAAHNVRLV
jgi:hypothetical protein